MHLPPDALLVARRAHSPAEPAHAAPRPPLQATAASVLRSYTDRVFYYKTPQNNQWQALSLDALAGAKQVLQFPLGLTDTPFATDVSAQGKAFVVEAAA